MAQQIINIDSVPGAGDGDEPHVAFTKVNNNFTELYTNSLDKIAGGEISGPTTYTGGSLSANSLVNKQYVDGLITPLAIATTSTRGGVIVGGNISVDSVGIISVTFPVTSVAGKTGVVTLNVADVANAASTSYVDSQIISTTSGLVSNSALTALAAQTTDALNLKADKATTYTISQINTLLLSKADSLLLSSNVDTINTQLNTKANAVDVYTKAEIDPMIEACALDSDLVALSAAVSDALNLKADKITTYTRSQLYTRAEIDQIISSHGGTSGSTVVSTVSYTASMDPVTINTFPISTFDTTEYLIRITSATGRQSSKVIVFYDGATLQVNEYAIMRSGPILGNFSATLASGNVQLLFTTTVLEGFAVKMHATRM